MVAIWAVVVKTVQESHDMLLRTFIHAGLCDRTIHLQLFENPTGGRPWDLDRN